MYEQFIDKSQNNQLFKELFDGRLDKSTTHLQPDTTQPLRKTVLLADASREPLTQLKPFR
ncbi:MAG: hypothetical protein JST62_06700 [Bacteroidetes bacterium]|nr:hypothetical protein [Bacteroidota bacterium]